MMKKSRVPRKLAKHFEEWDRVEENRPQEDARSPGKPKKEKRSSPVRRLLGLFLILLAAFWRWFCG